MARSRAEFYHWLSASGSHLLHPLAFQKFVAEVLGVAMSSAEAAQLVSLHDADQDGSLNFSEFACARENLSKDLARLRIAERQREEARQQEVKAQAEASRLSPMPDEVIDTRPMIRIVAMLAFLLPLADACRTMAPIQTEAVVGRAILDGMEILQPVVLAPTTSLQPLPGLHHEHALVH
eukprot:6472687-Amphidinium_carterae.1